MKKLFLLIGLVVLANGCYSTQNIIELPKCSSQYDSRKCHIEFEYTNGKYVGAWKDGKKHGQGTFTTWDSKEQYVGEWKNDKKHGQGTFKLRRGGQYVGAWKGGKMHGQGTFTMCSSQYDSRKCLKYVGAWKDDKMHGQGTFTTLDGIKYVGEWKDDHIDTLILPSGNKYVVEIKEDTIHLFTWPNGDQYVGELDDKGELIKREKVKTTSSSEKKLSKEKVKTTSSSEKVSSKEKVKTTNSSEKVSSDNDLQKLISGNLTKLACDCVKHDHKEFYMTLLGQPLHKEEKQCPSIPTIFYIDDEAMKFYGYPFHHNYPEWSLDIIKNLNNELSASGVIYEVFKGRLGVYKIDLNQDLKLNLLWDDKPPKKRRWVERKYNCKVLSTTRQLGPFEVKQQVCEKLGFSIRTEKNANCVLKILEIESQLNQKQESSGGQLSDTDKLIRQQSLNQSLLLMQQGLNLMNPPQPNLTCRYTFTGFTCG